MKRKNEKRRFSMHGKPSSIYSKRLLIRSFRKYEDDSVLEIGESKKNERCVLCDFLGESEEIYLDSLAKWIEDPEMLELFREGESVFCIPHLTAILRKVSDETASEILKIQLEKMRKVDDKLKSLIRKFDYRVKEEITAEEADARKIAAEILKGKDM